MTMAETANKIAADKLIVMMQREIQELRRQNSELIQRLYSETADIEVCGRKIIFHANDRRRNPPDGAGANIAGRASSA